MVIFHSYVKLPEDTRQRTRDAFRKWRGQKRSTVQSTQKKTWIKGLTGSKSGMKSIADLVI